MYDHVLGADPAVYPDWSGPYDIDTTFHEPLVFYGFLAAITTLELVTGIVIAPQRQTALLAKQAAEVDILTEGRFRLGLGIGWNAVEYEALGQDFTTRGRREEEQIGFLRRFWTERTVTHEGHFDRVTGAGLGPGRSSGPSRSGWAANLRLPSDGSAGSPTAGFPWPRAQLDQARAVVLAAAAEAGRDPSALGMEGRIHRGPAAPRMWPSTPRDGGTPGPRTWP